MKDINLFEGLHIEKNNYRKERFKSKILIGIVSLTLVGACALVGYNMIATQMIEKEIESIALDIDTYNEIMTLKNEISNKEIRLSAYRLLEQSGRANLDTEVLGLLAQMFPKGVSTNQLSYNSDGSIALNGQSTSVERVAYLIARLRERPEIASVFVSSVTANTQNKVASADNLDSAQTGDLAETGDTTEVEEQNISFSLSIILNN